MTTLDTLIDAQLRGAGRHPRSPPPPADPRRQPLLGRAIHYLREVGEDALADVLQYGWQDQGRNERGQWTRGGAGGGAKASTAPSGPKARHKVSDVVARLKSEIAAGELNDDTVAAMHTMSKPQLSLLRHQLNLGDKQKKGETTAAFGARLAREVRSRASSMGREAKLAKLSGGLPRHRLEGMRDALKGGFADQQAVEAALGPVAVKDLLGKGLIAPHNTRAGRDYKLTGKGHEIVALMGGAPQSSGAAPSQEGQGGQGGQGQEAAPATPPGRKTRLAPASAPDEQLTGRSGMEVMQSGQAILPGKELASSFTPRTMLGAGQTDEEGKELKSSFGPHTSLNPSAGRGRTSLAEEEDLEDWDAYYDAGLRLDAEEEEAQQGALAGRAPWEDTSGRETEKDDSEVIRGEGLAPIEETPIPHDFEEEDFGIDPDEAEATFKTAREIQRDESNRKAFKDLPDDVQDGLKGLADVADLDNIPSRDFEKAVGGRKVARQLVDRMIFTQFGNFLMGKRYELTGFGKSVMKGMKLARSSHYARRIDRIIQRARRLTIRETGAQRLARYSREMAEEAERYGWQEAQGAKILPSKQKPGVKAWKGTPPDKGTRFQVIPPGTRQKGRKAPSPKGGGEAILPPASVPKQPAYTPQKQRYDELGISPGDLDWMHKRARSEGKTLKPEDEEWIASHAKQLADHEMTGVASAGQVRRAYNAWLDKDRQAEPAADTGTGDINDPAFWQAQMGEGQDFAGSIPSRAETEAAMAAQPQSKLPKGPVPDTVDGAAVYLSALYDGFDDPECTYQKIEQTVNEIGKRFTGPQVKQITRAFKLHPLAGKGQNLRKIEDKITSRKGRFERGKAFATMGNNPPAPADNEPIDLPDTPEPPAWAELVDDEPPTAEVLPDLPPREQEVPVQPKPPPVQPPALPPLSPKATSTQVSRHIHAMMHGQQGVTPESIEQTCATLASLPRDSLAWAAVEVGESTKGTKGQILERVRAKLQSRLPR